MDVLRDAEGGGKRGEARNRGWAKFVRERKEGMAATEFAFILPIMVLLFFGMLEISDALMTNRRVANAANTLVDLVGQETEVTADELDDIFVGVTRMLEPHGASQLAGKIISISRPPSDPNQIIVDWSIDNEGGEPYAAGATYDKLQDDAVLHEGISLVVAELSYEYYSGLTGKVIGSPITFEKTVARWPRKSSKVVLCEESDADPDIPECVE